MKDLHTRSEKPNLPHIVLFSSGSSHFLNSSESCSFIHVVTRCLHCEFSIDATKCQPSVASMGHGARGHGVCGCFVGCDVYGVRGLL